MCIATFALGSSTDHPLVFAANRDELHTRPTEAADWWSDSASILGGRDLLAGGSWLAVDRRGRLAAVTNIPSDDAHANARSRGALVSDFLSGDRPATDFVASVGVEISAYRPFNFLAFDGRELHYIGTGSGAQRLEIGVHALSNAALGADWPKIHAAREGLAANLGTEDLETALFELLASGANGEAGPKDRLSRRKSIFIKDPRYGTRSSTVVLVSSIGRVRFAERSFSATGERNGESVHEFMIDA